MNSNYGWCVFSPENGDGKRSQYDFALEQLVAHPDGRQSVVFYNRPSMQWEWNDGLNAKHDFTCTFQTTQYVRDGALHYMVWQRSCDARFGLLNDYAWHWHVYHRFLDDLRKTTPDLKTGKVHYVCGSLHVYQRHWDLVKEIMREYDGLAAEVVGVRGHEPPRW